jgi:GT2 family glycosyltransferase
MISAIVLSMNSADTLEACLESVLASEPHDKEVIVVDGKSTDRTPEILSKYEGRIRVVYDECRGIGAARNLVVPMARHDLIACVDADVICEKRHFQKFLDYFNMHPEIAAIDTGGVHPEAGTQTQRMDGLYYQASEKHSSKQFALRGWSLSFRRSAWRAVGGFSTLGNSEDIDFSYRLRSAGFKIATIPTGSYHVPRGTLLRFLKEQKNWGRHAAWNYRVWGSSPLVISDLSTYRGWSFIRNVRVLVFLAYVGAPLTGLRYLRKTRRFELYLHFVMRQYANMLGFIHGNFDLMVHRNFCVPV